MPATRISTEIGTSPLVKKTRTMSPFEFLAGGYKEVWNDSKD